MFVAGVNSEDASRLATSLVFFLGHLLVHYLRLHLLSSRSRPTDCAPLIQHITNQIRYWSARVLSFVGRLKLVRFLLNSIQVY